MAEAAPSVYPAGPAPDTRKTEDSMARSKSKQKRKQHLNKQRHKRRQQRKKEERSGN